MSADTDHGVFLLDPRLAADTLVVTDLPLSRLLLMNDARFPWLILVPRLAGLCEVADLDAAAQSGLWAEIQRATAALRGAAPCDKINIGALGNIVRQLHVHVVARRQDDAAWPGPVWGHGPARNYIPIEAQALVRTLNNALASDSFHAD